MKTESQRNQMRPLPDSLVEAAAATLTTNSDTPKLVPLTIEDATARVEDLVIENAAGVPCSVYLFLIPDATKAIRPSGSKRQRKLTTIERLYRMGYTTDEIGKMYGHSAAAISLFMSRNGRPLSSIPRSPSSLILDPVGEPPAAQELILG
ncbi:hypothetical protein [Shewanella chilikensis]|uniref:hypothetical protein n=1 Tax=Shewanella chilikensis TaxID=558541 RepID=UPI00399A08F4